MYEKMMDEQEQRIFIGFLIGRLKSCFRELSVHRALAQMLREEGYKDVDAILGRARVQPALKQAVEEQFAWIDELAPPTPSQEYERAVREYLERWKPDGEPN
jgi:hypothetical protein